MDKNKNLKKVIIFGFLIIYIILFFFMISLVYQFTSYVLANNSLIINYFYILVFTLSAIFIISVSIPIVYYLDIRKVWLICMPFLLISIVLILFMRSILVYLFSGPILGIGVAGTLYIIDFTLINNKEGNKTKIFNCSMASFLSLIIVVLCIGLNLIFIKPIESDTPLPQPQTITPTVILSLRLLMLIFPVVALMMGSFIILIEKDKGK